MKVTTPFPQPFLIAALCLSALGATSTLARAAGPEVVAGPAADAQCFVPWTDKTKYFKYAKKPGPYRIALANGFIGNTWRIQMIKTAKAYAEQPEVKKQLKEFKVVSTGDDIAAQISAVNNFIDSGYDAVVIDAQNPTAFKGVVKRAQAAGVVLVAFDNTIDTDAAINVNVDQEGLGKYWGDWLVKNLPKGGSILEVRGVTGTSVDTDRHKGLQETLKASGQKFETVEVVGRWDDGTAQKVSADALAVHKKFDGMTAQGGSTGMVRAFMDAGAPLVPAAAETENGFRKLCLADQAKGLNCASGGTGPAQVAVAIKTALTALNGDVVPQSIRLPLAHVEDPGFKAGDNVYPDQTDNFFVGNSFPTCGINFTAQEIMGRSEANQ
ncbi:sugar ABC transporter substrate-binding protein [Lichenifustis flavocetrariae]|uniref:Sugar ABC transporter substrate-binding protein n=1 Tax=Lichenifustis flavocetrariae TaxID=2949735 RepID=A0AA42CMB1_9HYPH|nr:sugar ABC transporter substrate-binding protein [Lichenifustis flavocetrariae]MCW6511371.1 sugar ABC transporter substrate-binding protein [Lichenifustis flavocetrariae]